MMDTQESTPASESAGASAASATSDDSNNQMAAATSQEDSKSISDVVEEKIAKVAGKAGAKSAPDTANVDAGTPVVTPDGKVAYTPNFKYKVAGQEKELDAFWHPLVKDADSEKKVKELFSKVDAFDYMKGKKEHFEEQYSTLNGDYEQLSGQVDRFDKSVQSGDLSSAFRIAGIPKEAVYRWVSQQLQYEELPPEQKAQIEAAESARMQQMDYEDKISRMEKQFQSQAVQTRTMQLDFALNKPEVASFAASWDQNAEPGFTFRDTVAAEARRVWYETKQDLSPDQAVALVMSRFGRLVSTGGPEQSQSPQVISQQAPQARHSPPVIPNVTGKASSPIKKVPRSIEDLKAIAKSMS